MSAGLRLEARLHDYFLVHPFRTGVPEIGLERRPRGDPPRRPRAAPASMTVHGA
jgi:hypothetical protein